MIKLAIPTDDGKTIAPHFGKAQYFSIVSSVFILLAWEQLLTML